MMRKSFFLPFGASSSVAASGFGPWLMTWASWDAASMPGSSALASDEAVERTTTSTRRLTVIAVGSVIGTSGLVDE